MENKVKIDWYQILPVVNKAEQVRVAKTSNVGGVLSPADDKSRYLKEVKVDLKDNKNVTTFIISTTEANNPTEDTITIGSGTIFYFNPTTNVIFFDAVIGSDTFTYTLSFYGSQAVSYNDIAELSPDASKCNCNVGYAL